MSSLLLTSTPTSTPPRCRLPTTTTSTPIPSTRKKLALIRDCLNNNKPLPSKTPIRGGAGTASSSLTPGRSFSAVRERLRSESVFKSRALAPGSTTTTTTAARRLCPPSPLLSSSGLAANDCSDGSSTLSSLTRRFTGESPLRIKIEQRLTSRLGKENTIRQECKESSSEVEHEDKKDKACYWLAKISCLITQGKMAVVGDEEMKRLEEVEQFVRGLLEDAAVCGEKQICKNEVKNKFDPINDRFDQLADKSDPLKGRSDQLTNRSDPPHDSSDAPHDSLCSSLSSLNVESLDNVNEIVSVKDSPVPQARMESGNDADGARDCNDQSAPSTASLIPHEGKDNSLDTDGSQDGNDQIAPAEDSPIPQLRMESSNDADEAQDCEVVEICSKLVGNSSVYQASVENVNDSDAEINAISPTCHEGPSSCGSNAGSPICHEGPSSCGGDDMTTAPTVESGEDWENLSECADIGNNSMNIEMQGVDVLENKEGEWDCGSPEVSVGRYTSYLSSGGNSKTPIRRSTRIRDSLGTPATPLVLADEM